jgi:hypothetical protein
MRDRESGEYFEIKSHEWHRGPDHVHLEFESSDDGFEILRAEFVALELQRVAAFRPETGKKRGGRPPKDWECFG